MIIDDTEMANIHVLLTKFNGKWKVEKEPVTLVDAMPYMCYLFDDSLGKGIEINGYKKIAEVVHRNACNSAPHLPALVVYSRHSY